METLLRPVIISTSSRPAAAASSTTYWMAGLSTTGSISFGVALVAGRNRVPSPAAGTTALRTARTVRAGEPEAWEAIMRPMLADADESPPREPSEPAVGPRRWRFRVPTTLLRTQLGGSINDISNPGTGTAGNSFEVSAFRSGAVRTPCFVSVNCAKVSGPIAAPELDAV